MAISSSIAKRIWLSEPIWPGSARNWNKPNPIALLLEDVHLRRHVAGGPGMMTMTSSKEISHEEDRDGESETRKAGTRRNGEAEKRRKKNVVAGVAHVSFVRSNSPAGQQCCDGAADWEPGDGAGSDLSTGHLCNSQCSHRDFGRTRYREWNGCNSRWQD